ncbi:MAG: 3'-5' exonuclease, partial [Caldimicrobium sp.]
EASEFIADKVIELREKGLKLSQIAVLFRSAYHSYDLEVELTKRGIPFVKYGGLKLIEAAHIKDLLALMKILLNPRDFLSWNRILLLLEGIGPRTAEKIVNLLKNEPIEISLSKVPINFPLAELKRFFEVYTSLKPYEKAPSEILQSLWEFYEPIFQRIYYEDYFRRIKDIEGLFALSAKYATLDEFLTDLLLEPIEILDTETLENKEEDTLILSTIHSAKGLEWHTVFILSLIEGRFPSLHSLQKEEELEEERRLFYVAVTRAREELFLISPILVYLPGEGKTLAKPSRFIKEIPQSLMEEVTTHTTPKKPSINAEAYESDSEPLENLSKFRVGNIVKHPHFGEGVVLEVLGEKIKVNFVSKGPTLLHLKYTHLEKLA